LWRAGSEIPYPCRQCGLSGFSKVLLLVSSPATRGLSPPMCVPASQVNYCKCLPVSCEGFGPWGIVGGPSNENRPMVRRRPMAWLSCGLSPRGDSIVAFELMALLVVVDVCANLHLIGTATHRSLFFASGIRYQRLQLVVRDCTVEVGKGRVSAYSASSIGPLLLIGYLIFIMIRGIMSD